ncbi:CAMK family protein kinase [Trichomonas vaginalis G3]|uniref:non-specific serine/threonine protein kinase n=1 Tax=Trichomonas vaginalis (strain ATCC PRA-98 / G3) TaxID=412133 RepID=A2DW97_TRIV3|nr:protein serine/threonine kinase protein [Trichomonas vaginalis G3]EAY15398.1 CAMK family protein kinase [Trichomonas vaginalis G3]KAI5496727.1 protein serine/threonine kinase protein [Trichomonas vaginalis G3]|eukprot:XP_001327621.1 CAMK family protein kinase [Trichomonas vaginalis G3]
MNFPILSKYEVQHKIGDGGFAEVYYAIHKASGLPVAIKKIPKIVDDNDSHLALVRREIDIMKHIPHPFIADFYEVLENNDFIFIVMEYISNGTLRNTLNEMGPFTEENAAIIFAQIVLVLKFLHQKCNVVHRDLKSDNILFDKNGNIRVIDFGLSNTKATDEILKTQCGTPSYASPEMILGEKYDYSSDIWSAGIVLYEIVTGNLPFDDPNMARLAQKIIFKEVEFPSGMSSQLIDLIQKLLTKDQTKRIKLSEIEEHPWVKNQIRFVEEKLDAFKYDKEKIAESLGVLGVDYSKIVEEIKQKGIKKCSSLEYNLVRRNYLIEHLESFGTKKDRRKSVNECVPVKIQIPNLVLKKHPVNLRRLTSRQQVNASVILSIGRKAPPKKIQLDL